MNNGRNDDGDNGNEPTAAATAGVAVAVTTTLTVADDDDGRLRKRKGEGAGPTWLLRQQSTQSGSGRNDGGRDGKRRLLLTRGVEEWEEDGRR